MILAVRRSVFLVLVIALLRLPRLAVEAEATGCDVGWWRAGTGSSHRVATCASHTRSQVVSTTVVECRMPAWVFFCVR